MSRTETNPNRAGGRTDAPDLSLTASLFLIAIDPAKGRLVKRRRRRFRKALATSYGAAGPGGATRARRAAIDELRAVGFIERSLLPGRYPVIRGSGSSKPLARMRRCIAGGAFQERRDVELFVLLAWTGVLARRLERSERNRARQRLKELFSPPAAQHSELAPIPPIAAALGQVVLREEIDQVWEMVNDLLSGDAVTFDPSGGSVSGGDSGSHGDAGSGGEGGSGN